MAYDATGLYNNGPLGSNPRIFIYESTDVLATVIVAGYFTDGDLRGLSVGDLIYIVDTTTPSNYLVQVSSVTEGGSATVIAG